MQNAATSILMMCHLERCFISIQNRRLIDIVVVLYEYIGIFDDTN